MRAWRARGSHRAGAGCAPGFPAGVWVSAAFFALAGLLDLVLTLREVPRPLPFWPVWEAVGRLIFHLLARPGASCGGWP